MRAQRCKRLYEKARQGTIKNFTGISAPYESPINPDIEIETEKETAEAAAKKIIKRISRKLKI